MCDSLLLVFSERVMLTLPALSPHRTRRQFTVQEIRLLARIAGLEVAQLYGDMSASIGLSHEEAYRLVAVLKKPLSSA